MKTHLQPSKLVAFLQLLTPEEFKTFHKWLQSPWANANRKLVECYAFLQKHYPAFDAKSLTKEDLFAKLYPGKKYDDKWMRNIMGGLSKQVEKFLVHQRLEKDEILTKQLLAKEYRERHRNDWFEKQANEIVEILEAKAVKETDDYLALVLIHDDLYQHSKSTSVQTYLQIAELYLDTFFSITKWRHLTELKERQLILPEEGELNDKMERLSYFTKDLDIPVIELYRNRLVMGAGLEKDGYFSLKEKYLLLFEQLPLWDKKLLLFYLINSVIRLWMKGDLEIVKELLNLYKTGIDNGLLFHHGRLTESTYANITTSANSVGDFSFSKKFIEKYTSYLPPGSNVDGKVWAKAQWHYKQKQFEKSIDLLSKHQFGDNIFIRNGRFLLLQSYFDACLLDNSYYLFFKDFCEASKKYFNRDKTLSKNRNEAYINLINYSYKLIKMINERTLSVQLLQNFSFELDKENNIQGKLWLTNKIEEIKNGLPN